MKKFSLICFLLLLFFHTQNSFAHPFSWLFDSCKEYVHQFNDLDTWKKISCVLVGVVAFDKCVSITKGTWRFFFGKQSQSHEQENSQELHQERGNLTISASSHRAIKREETTDENQHDNQENHEILLDTMQMRQVYFALRHDLKKQLKHKLKEQLKSDVLKYTNNYTKRLLDLTIKNQELHRKIKELRKQVFLAHSHKASTYSKPAVPRLNLRGALRRPRTPAFIMPSQETLQKLHEQTTIVRPSPIKSSYSSSDDISSSSSSSDDEDSDFIPAITTGGTTPTSSSARTSNTSTPHNSLDSDRIFGTDQGTIVENIYDKQGNIEGYKVTPRGKQLPPSPLANTYKRSGTDWYSTKSRKSGSAPASLRTPPQTRREIKKSRSMSDFDKKAIEKAKKKFAQSQSSEPDEYIITEEGDTVAIPTTPATPLSAHFVDLSKLAKDDNSNEENNDNQQQTAEDRFYYDHTRKDNCGIT